MATITVDNHISCQSIQISTPVVMPKVLVLRLKIQDMVIEAFQPQLHKTMASIMVLQTIMQEQITDRVLAEQAMDIMAVATNIKAILEQVLQVTTETPTCECQ